MSSKAVELFYKAVNGGQIKFGKDYSKGKKRFFKNWTMTEDQSCIKCEKNAEGNVDGRVIMINTNMFILIGRFRND